MRPVICCLNFSLSLEAFENLITPFHRREMMKGGGVEGGDYLKGFSTIIEENRKIIWKNFSLPNVLCEAYVNSVEL